MLSKMRKKFVPVDASVTGKVIGIKGSTVKKIKRRTGTIIWSPKKKNPPFFEVLGTPKQIEMATLLIKKLEKQALDEQQLEKQTKMAQQRERRKMANLKRLEHGPIYGECIFGKCLVKQISSSSGLVVCQDCTDLGTLYFKLQSFCDQMVTDLGSVIRPGFILTFTAYSFMEEIEVVSLRPQEGQGFEMMPAADMGLLPEDPYNLELERRAIPVLLEIFKRNGLTYCQLSWLARAFSSMAEEELIEYVGTSESKMARFFQKRTHIFALEMKTGTVTLQPPLIYTTVIKLNSFLQSRGGVCSMQQLFDHFAACPEMPITTANEMAFCRFLDEHPWIFSVFPSKVFVSSRRQLMELNYPAYMEENFGKMAPIVGDMAVIGVTLIKEMAAELGLGVKGLLAVLRSPTAEAGTQTDEGPEAEMKLPEGASLPPDVVNVIHDQARKNKRPRRKISLVITLDKDAEEDSISGGGGGGSIDDTFLPS